MKSITETLDEAITAKDIPAIKSVLSTCFVEDPGFSKGTLDESIKYCLSHGITENELFDVHDGSIFSDNPTEWTRDYYSSQRVDFRANFSKERLEHLRKVGKKLFPASQPRSPADVKKNYQTPERESEIPSWVPIAVAAVVVAAVVGVVALVLA
jgi:hypothetical protein